MPIVLILGRLIFHTGHMLTRLQKPIIATNKNVAINTDVLSLYHNGNISPFVILVRAHFVIPRGIVFFELKNVLKQFKPPLYGVT